MIVRKPFGEQAYLIKPPVFAQLSLTLPYSWLPLQKEFLEHFDIFNVLAQTDSVQDGNLFDTLISSPSLTLTAVKTLAYIILCMKIRMQTYKLYVLHRSLYCRIPELTCTMWITFDMESLQQNPVFPKRLVSEYFSVLLTNSFLQ